MIAGLILLLFKENNMNTNIISQFKTSSSRELTSGWGFSFERNVIV
jgi:hypothetical protein